MPGLYTHATRADQTELTADIYNADHQNHITNSIPTKIDDYSSTVTEMRREADPYPSDSESLALHLAGEIERLRFMLRSVTGRDYWYQPPSGSIEDVWVDNLMVNRFAR